MISKLFSGKDSDFEPRFQPQNFMECLDVISSWNVQISYNIDMEMHPDTLQAAMDTLVTCPFCGESYYFSDTVELHNTWLHVECPHCQVSPLDEDEEENIALL